MRTMIITEETLKEILGEAFDAGWYGSKELKESVLEDLVAKVKKLVGEMQGLNDDQWVQSVRIEPRYSSAQEWGWVVDLAPPPSSSRGIRVSER